MKRKPTARQLAVFIVLALIGACASSPGVYLPPEAGSEVAILLLPERGPVTVADIDGKRVPTDVAEIPIKPGKHDIGIGAEHSARLGHMEREVLRERFAMPAGRGGKSLIELGRRFGLTRERIRQIQVAAIKKIRAVVELGDSRSTAASARQER